MTLEYIGQNAIKETRERFRYRSFAKPGGKSFVHLALFADEAAFKEFQSLPGFPVFGQELSADLLAAFSTATNRQPDHES